MRQIAAAHGLSESALHRHETAHLPGALITAEGAREAAKADALLGETLGLEAKALELVAVAQAEGDVRAAVVALREARECLALRAKVAGEIGKASAAGAFTMSWQDVAEVRARLRERLERHRREIPPETLAELVKLADDAGTETPAP